MVGSAFIDADRHRLFYALTLITPISDDDPIRTKEIHINYNISQNEVRFVFLANIASDYSACGSSLYYVLLIYI